MKIIGFAYVKKCPLIDISGKGFALNQGLMTANVVDMGKKSCPLILSAFRQFVDIGRGDNLRPFTKDDEKWLKNHWKNEANKYRNKNID